MDIKKYPVENISEIPNNRLIFPITVDSKGENKIEILPQKASMGYLNGYSDPDYIESLQNFFASLSQKWEIQGFPCKR